MFEAAGMKCTGINPDSDLVEEVGANIGAGILAHSFTLNIIGTVVSPNPLLSFMEAAAATREENI